jgi:N-terminal acetyltransferase B complex non-catalytic subunit
LKFEYLIDLSLNPEPTLAKAEDFVISCISIYKSSLPLSFGLEPTDTQYGDDSGILAAMGLIYLANFPSEEKSFSRSRSYLLQAAALLQFLSSRSRHNFQAILILVRLYGLLGACSLAMEAYPRLSIKQIQNDTLAHNIFSRISTLHPHQVVGFNHLEKGDRDPSLGLLKALMVYGKSATQIPDLAKIALEKGSVDQVEGFLEFADRVRNSICRVMWSVERRRIARLTRTKPSSIDGPDFDHIGMDTLPSILRVSEPVVL